MTYYDNVINMVLGLSGYNSGRISNRVSNFSNWLSVKHEDDLKYCESNYQW